MSLTYCKLTRKIVKKNLGNRLVISVNPDKIDMYVGVNIPFIKTSNMFLHPIPPLMKFAGSVIRDFTPFVVSNNFYQRSQPLEHLEKFTKVEDIIRNRKNYKRSSWYNSLLLEIRNGGKAMHKRIPVRTEEELSDFFEHYVLALIRSMESEGYKHKKGRRPGKVSIGADGSLHKSNAADHRFFIAKLLGLQSIPLEIQTVHKDWFLEEGIPNSISGLEKLSEAIKKVEQRHR